MIKLASQQAFGTVTTQENHPNSDVAVLGVEINPQDFTFPKSFSAPTGPIVVGLENREALEEGDIVRILHLSHSFDQLTAKTTADIPRMENSGIRTKRPVLFPEARKVQI